MTQTIEISNELYDALGKLATSFKDTPADVIQRLLDERTSGMMPSVQTQLRQRQNGGRRTRSRITAEMAKRACKLGDEVNAQDLKEIDAREELVKMGMNETSAFFYIYAYLNMLHGELFKRGAKISDLRLFMEHINDEYGEVGFENAVGALRKHIKYLSDNDIPYRRAQELLDEMEAKL